MGLHLKKSDYISVPWKNGLGTTVEIASAKNVSGAEAEFLWRISIADMVEDTAFSCFAGVDRTLTVIDGNGLVLEGETLATPLRCTSFKPTFFSGDDALTGLLNGGAVKNFNVMVDRQKAAAKVSVLELTNVSQSVSVKAAVSVFHVPARGSAVDMCYQGTQLKLLPGESFLLQEKSEAELLFRSETATGKLLHVVIDVESS